MNVNFKLGSRCGTSIDPESLTFSPSRSNLVYMDKVYSYNKTESCPLLLALTTTPETYTAVLTATDPNCNCGCGDNCGVDLTSSFVVTNAYVIPEQFILNGPLTAAQLTVNGIAVDSVTEENGQYVASTAGLISQIQRDCCSENGLPTKTFFLASAIGPWAIRFRVILEGTVTTGGKSCCFRAEFVNNDDTFVALPDLSLSNFAIPKLSLPCAINGIAPTIRFQFGAAAQILNPILTVTADPDAGTSVASNLILSGTLVISPTMAAEVVRKSLFCVTACEAMLPCDGSEEALAAAQDVDNDDDCNPFGPDCACGSSRTPSPNAVTGGSESHSGGCGNCGVSPTNTIITRPGASNGNRSCNSCGSNSCSDCGSGVSPISGGCNSCSSGVSPVSGGCNSCNSYMNL